MAADSTGCFETLVVYYSRTGTTEMVADQLEAALSNPTVEEISPSAERGYLNWLCRSFAHGLSVDIESPRYDPQAYDSVFLGTPKWTVNCPPVTAYLSAVSLADVPVGLFLTYGGFDQRRYARELTRRLQRGGAEVPARLLVQRDQARSIPDAALKRFLDSVFGSV